MTTFIDTSALLAILDADEERHGDARSEWAALLERDEPCVTTNYVLVETCALTTRRLGAAAVRVLSDDILPIVDVEWIDRESHERAVAALVAAGRRDLSLVDIISFDAMRRRGIQTAFAFDRHFLDAGFALLPAK
jgi:predicted nucleic acid-binding protein